MTTEANAGDAAGRVATGEVELDAPVERVWRALTEGAELERWFPLQARVEPGVGGSVWMSWANEFAGASEILVWDPPRVLRTVWKFHPDDGPAQVTEYTLEPRGGRTFLRVVTSGFPADASWDEWLEGTKRGWRFELESLRTYLEQHEGRERAVIYLRRRMTAPATELWSRLFGPEAPEHVQPTDATLDVSPPYQHVARLADPPGALLRVSIEPAGTSGEERDVTFFLSDWSGSERRRAVLSEGWAQVLERLFPEGRTV